MPGGLQENAPLLILFIFIVFVAIMAVWLRQPSAAVDVDIAADKKQLHRRRRWRRIGDDMVGIVDDEPALPRRDRVRFSPTVQSRTYSKRTGKLRGDEIIKINDI